MTGTTDSTEKSKPTAGNKVSKPLMEKKRRARINKCLDQLKTLLESSYSSSIRKRKLEKADILELTVKHLRNLQKIQSYSAAASEFSDYQAGFRSCMANVNQYLRMADILHGNDGWKLSQLPANVRLSRGQEEVFSTTDSSAGEAEAPGEQRRILQPAARLEDRKLVPCKGPKHHRANKCQSLPSRDTQQPRVTKQAVSMHGPSPSEGSPSEFPSACEAAHKQEHVWRPW